PGYSSAGYYQETETSPIAVNKFSGNGGPLGYEYIQNDPMGSKNDFLYLSQHGGGWTTSASGVNGAQVGKVSNLNNPTSGTTAFVYRSGGLAFGTNQSFTFNGFDLSGTGQNVQFEAIGSDLSTVLDTSALYNLTSTSQHIEVDWQNVYEIIFISNDAAGSITMDNVAINGSVPTVPEPSTLLLLGSSLAGMAAYRRKFKKA
ncbi:MAG: PEP-CTERM sorting domain-containing protein, partial [Syntrophobacteraceae bacterium]|nr:PEP-CTERM sorting domain-containing protein [Syntrophobacteraceae bacterium]